jgi:hypothetical protein
VVLSEVCYTEQYLANMVPVYWQQIIVRGTTLHKTFDIETRTNGYRMTYNFVHTYVNALLDLYPFFRCSIISLFLHNYIDRHTWPFLFSHSGFLNFNTTCREALFALLI